MAEASQNLVLEGVKGLLMSGDYSDLVITCQSDSYKVHKNVETQENSIDLAEDDPKTVKLLMQYLYEGEYEPRLSSINQSISARSSSSSSYKKGRTRRGYSQLSMEWDTKEFKKDERCFPHTCRHDGSGDCDNSWRCQHHKCGITCDNNCIDFLCSTCHQAGSNCHDSRQVLTHSQMYEIADKYDVTGLKDLSKEKFHAACQLYWNEVTFTEAATHASLTTPDNDEGLREIVIKTITEHLELINKPEIDVLLTRGNGLAFGVLKQKMEQGWR
ncbi:hypothetical protein N0V90_004984 [Kalmusia sp. IMI 367209]|nr:hypothetical protein N0V90_004984 [Kalmusia sp. IMI 367209]